MKKSVILKLLVLTLALSMILSLFACDSEKETESETSTEAEETVTQTETDKGDDPTEAPTSDPTEAPTSEVTETETVTEAPTETETDVPTETESATEAPTETESATEAPTETESETEEETSCYHPYDSTQEGHWKPACDVCGKGVGKMQDHEYSEYVEDEGDLLYYSYVCDICGYVAYAQEVPYEINLFYPASEIANFDSSAGAEGTYHFESGIGYGSFSHDKVDSGVTSVIYVEDSGSMEDDPIGQYVAIKLRMPRSQNSLTLTIQSVHATNPYTLRFPNLKPGWLTLVIDLAKIAKVSESADGKVTSLGYVGDSFDEFYLKTFSISAYIGAGESFDISYIAFCEEYEDIMTIVEGENNYFVYEDALTKEPEKFVTDCKHDYIMDLENGTHTLKESCYICGTSAVTDEKHSIIEIVGNGKNSYECSVCAYAQYYKVVPVEVNKYYSASELNAGGIIYYPYTGFGHGMYVETGDAYTRYDGPTSLNNGKPFNVGQVIFARDDADFNPQQNGEKENGIRINVGDAIYFVLRVRVNTEGLRPLKVTISTTGHAGFDSGEGNPNFSIPVASTPANTWNTYVINLAEVFPTKYLPDENGDYIIDTYYFNICEGNFAPGCTLDLSYMAYCSSWDEVAGLVDEDKIFYLSDRSGGGNWVDTDSRGCESHTLGGAKITEKDGKTTYQFMCSVCGQPAVSKTVESSVTRYYYAGEIASTAKTYFQMNGSGSGKGGQIIYDEASEIVYSRFTGYKDGDEAVTGQMLWQRAQEDMWDGQNSNAPERYTESIGNAEWFVMRVKSSSATQDIYLTFSTTAYNAEDGANMGRRMGGMIEVKIPMSAAVDGEWTTYAVNLKEVAPEAFVKDDMGTDGEYIMDSFYFSFPSFALSTNIDIEYMAFVDGSWAEIDALVADETVVNLTDTVGTFTVVNTATGEAK